MSYIFRKVADILRSKLRASSSLRQTDHSDSVSYLMVWRLFPRSTTENLKNNFGRFFTEWEKKLARVTANYKQKQEKESDFRRCSRFHSFVAFYNSCSGLFFILFPRNISVKIILS